jgi:hypothetical protein
MYIVPRKICKRSVKKSNEIVSMDMLSFDTGKATKNFIHTILVRVE